MIRGAVYRIDLGDARRGQQQRGRRYGLVMSPSAMAWSVATIVPTSSTAQPAVFRPEIHLGDSLTRFLVDQICTLDTTYIDPEPSFYLAHDDLDQVEAAVASYLGLHR